jgi:hypothetical protein
MNDKQRYEIHERILRLLDNQCDLVQFQQLQTWLREDPDAVAYYCEFLQEYSAIRAQIESENISAQFEAFDKELWVALSKEETEAKTIEMPKEKPQRELIQKVVYTPYEKRKVSKFQIATFVMSTAAILFFVLFLKFAPQNYSIEVATLVDQMGVKWANSTVDLQSGDRLLTNHQSIGLAKGIVKIQYDDGVEVIIEGPAVFEIEQSGIFLDYGRTYCRVSSLGLGFTVETPSSKFFDMGTEFGVQADINGSAELHVTQGKVQLFAGSEKQDKLSQMVTTDTAVSYNATVHEIKSVPVEKHRFVSQIDSKTKMISRGYANRYEAAVAEIRPAAWYRFEKGPAALGYDEISNTVTSCEFSEPVTLADGQAMDSVQGNQSLYLSGNAGSGVFLSDKVVKPTGSNALSISLWIRPEAGMTRPQNIICYTDHQEQTNPVRTNQLYLTPDNRVGFSVYNLHGADISMPFAWWAPGAPEKAGDLRILTDDPLPLNRWFHLTACFSDTKIELYINGRLCASEPMRVRTEFYEGGYWGIGCMTADSGKIRLMGPLYHYKGYVDEISFYDRLLTAPEIQSLYEAAGVNP